MTFVDILEKAVAACPDKIAISIDGDKEITYKQLYEKSFNLSKFIKKFKSNNIAILLPNSIEWVIGFFAIAMANKVSVLLNSRLTNKELAYQIDQSDSGAIIVGDVHNKNINDILLELNDSCEQCREIVWCGNESIEDNEIFKIKNFHELCEIKNENDLESVDQDSDGTIIYTSGTTSLPKGVVLRQKSIVMNALFVGQALGITENDKIFSAGPFCHSGGLTMHIVMSIFYKATAYSVSYFDPAKVLNIVEKNQCTIYSGIETLFLRLLDVPGFSASKMRSVRTGWSTGSKAIMQKVADEVGVPGIVGVYGISEASPNVCISHYLESPELRLGTMGRKHPQMQLRVVDPVTEKVLGYNQVGELQVSGYSVMKGYYRKDKETAEALQDGWLKTGDMVFQREDGYFQFSGRSKDIVRVGGENVSAMEVENALYEIDGIALAAVLAKPDKDLGEVAVAVIKMINNNHIKKEDVFEILKSKLASYKIPREIIIYEDMPLTDSGKIQKNILSKKLFL